MQLSPQVNAYVGSADMNKAEALLLDSLLHTNLPLLNYLFSFHCTLTLTFCLP